MNSQAKIFLSTLIVLLYGELEYLTRMVFKFFCELFFKIGVIRDLFIFSIDNVLPLRFVLLYRFVS